MTKDHASEEDNGSASEATESLEQAVQQPGDLNLSEGKAQNVIPVAVNPAEELPVTGLTRPDTDAEASAGDSGSSGGESPHPPSSEE